MSTITIQQVFEPAHPQVKGRIMHSQDSFPLTNAPIPIASATSPPEGRHTYTDWHTRLWRSMTIDHTRRQIRTPQSLLQALFRAQHLGFHDRSRKHGGSWDSRRRPKRSLRPRRRQRRGSQWHCPRFFHAQQWLHGFPNWHRGRTEGGFGSVRMRILLWRTGRQDVLE